MTVVALNVKLNVILENEYQECDMGPLLEKMNVLKLLKKTTTTTHYHNFIKLAKKEFNEEMSWGPYNNK